MHAEKSKPRSGIVVPAVTAVWHPLTSFWFDRGVAVWCYLLCSGALQKRLHMPLSHGRTKTVLEKTLQLHIPSSSQRSASSKVLPDLRRRGE